MDNQPEIEQKPKKRFRKLKKVFFILLSLFLVALISGIVLANVYEKEIKRFAIDEINTHLKAKLKINEDDVRFSFFKKFPNASLNFADILIEKENDTILFAENFSLEFGLASLFSRNYSVKEMELDDAIVNLHVDKKGNENYIFWKENDETDTTESKLSFSLKDVNFHSVKLNYVNQQSLNNATLNINEASFSGDFGADSSIVSIQSDLFIENVNNDSTVYFTKKQSKLSVKKGVFTTDEITLDNGNLSIGNMSLELNCVFNLKKEESTLKGIASNVEISEIFSLMPNEVSETLKAYQTDGTVNGNIEIKTRKSEATPRINADFTIAKGTITEKNSGVELSNLDLIGTYELSPISQRIELSKATGNLSGGLFSLTGKILGNETQTILTNIQGDFELDKLAQFLNIDAIDFMSGKLILNNEFSGSLREGDLSVSEFVGTAKLIKASLKMKNALSSYSGFNGDITFNRYKSNATLVGNYGNSDLSINSQFSNFIPYLFNNQELEANFYLQSQLLELDQLLGNEKKEIETGNDTTGVKFPERVNATIRAKIAKLVYHKHELLELSGIISLNEKQLSTTDLTFGSNKGKYNAKGMLFTQGEGFKLESNIVCGQIDMSDVLSKFNNFGQEVVKSEHLTGIANAVISIESNLTKHLELDMASLSVNTEFTISEGELNNLEMFQEIADYLKSNTISNTIVKVDELAKKLKSVKFSEFSNTIQIKNRVITIPSMIIKTSAMDIGLYGTQSFDYEINYGINIRLTDLLTKKKDSEFGYIVDDGSGARLFLLMTGTMDKPIYKLDKEGRKAYQEKQREAERNNLKGILKDEFGLFKNDTSARKIEVKSNSKPKFEVKWEEENTPKKEGTSSGQNISDPDNSKEDKPKKKSKWLKKLTGEEDSEKEKKKVGFEVE
jgi:hypothetical protein